jgi:hypothetical protein
MARLGPLASHGFVICASGCLGLEQAKTQH